MKGVIKHLVAGVLRYTGVLGWMVRRRIRGRGFVLMYHRVLDTAQKRESFSSPSIVSSPAAFRAHMRLLRNHFDPVTPAEFHRRLHERDLRPGTCLVTFDDGWADNLANALPVLETERVPAVFFLATDFVGSDRSFWQEHVCHMLTVAARAPAPTLQALLSELGLAHLRTAPEASLKTAARKAVNDWKSRSPEWIAELTSRLRDALAAESLNGEPASIDRFMDWGEARRLGSGVARLGSHACSHTPLDHLPIAAATQELFASREKIRQLAAQNVDTLAYPNGNHNDEVAAAAREAGYLMAFTTVSGTVAPGDDPFKLKRINVHDGAASSATLLLARIAGLF